MATIDDRIKAAEQKAIEAKERLKVLKSQKEAREQKELMRTLKKERAKDTRRKILAGAWLLESVERDPEKKQRVIEGLGRFLKRADDRALFDLPPLEG